MTWRVLALFSLVLLSPTTACMALEPAARVERSVVDRPGRPEVLVTVPVRARYLGADRFILKEISDCEMHVFVEADSQRRVKRFYWVHFESNLPSRPGDHMHYGDTDDRSKLWGVTIWSSSEPALMSRVPKPGSDTEHFRKIIQDAGYTMPPAMATARLVRLLDDPNGTGTGRREVMMLYGEDLASDSLTWDDVTTQGKADNRWAALKAPLLKRAERAFTFAER